MNKILILFFVFFLSFSNSFALTSSQTEKFNQLRELIESYENGSTYISYIDKLVESNKEETSYLNGIKNKISNYSTSNKKVKNVLGYFYVKIVIAFENSGKSVIENQNGDISQIQNLISQAKNKNVTYITLGDSIREKWKEGGDKPYIKFKSTLEEKGVNYKMLAKGGHSIGAILGLIPNQYNGLLFDEIISEIPGDGTNVIIEISMLLNDDKDTEYRLSKLISDIKTKKPNILFLLVSPNPNNGPGERRQQRIKDIHNAYLSASKKYNIPYIDFKPIMGKPDSNNSWSDLYDDGLHFNEKGEMMTVEFILSKIIK